MNKQEALDLIKKDFEKCLLSKTKVDNNIVKWIRQYDGDKYGNEVAGRSEIVVKDIKKAIKKMNPSLIQPFISNDVMVKAKPKTLDSAGTASLAGAILNYQYNEEFDKLGFIRNIALILPKEGTVWIRTGWEFDEKVEKKSLSNLRPEDLMVLQQQSNEIEEVSQNRNGTYNLTIVKRTPIANNPTAIICKNENIYVDPTAENFKEAKFVIHKFEKTISDLKKMESIYTIPSNDELLKYTNSTTEYNDTSLSMKRYNDSISTGKDYLFSSSSDANKKVTVLEYWGEFDLNGDGKAEQIVFAWIKGSNTVIRCESNPYPDNAIPFCVASFDVEPFSIWGKSVADSIEDNQKIHTAIMRGFIDNMSLSNNGQKFFRKGALDYINMQKLLNGEKVIEVNDIEGFRDGAYNQIPQTSFNIFDMQSTEIEQLTGVSRNLDGVDNATIGRTSSGVNSTMTAAQRHMVILIHIISNLYKDIFTKWHTYNQVFLDEGQMFEIAGKLVQFAKDDIAGSHKIEVNVNLDAMNQQKIGQINMLLQQTQNMGGAIPPMVVPNLVAEVFSSFGKEELADQIRTYQPQPDPMQQALQQAQLEELQAKVALLQAQAQESMANAGNKSAQGELHKVKADNLDADTLAKMRENNSEQGSNELDNMLKQADLTSKYQDMQQSEESHLQQLGLNQSQANLQAGIALSKAKQENALKVDAHNHKKQLDKIKQNNSSKSK